MGLALAGWSAFMVGDVEDGEGDEGVTGQMRTMGNGESGGEGTSVANYAARPDDRQSIGTKSQRRVAQILDAARTSPQSPLKYSAKIIHSTSCELDGFSFYATQNLHRITDKAQNCKLSRSPENGLCRAYSTTSGTGQYCEQRSTSRSRSLQA